jgi:hypothetical protein
MFAKAMYQLDDSQRLAGRHVDPAVNLVALVKRREFYFM